MTSILNSYLIIALMVMVAFAIYLSIREHIAIKNIAKTMKDEIDSYKSTIIEMENDFTAEIEYEEEDDEETEHTGKKEEIKLEVDHEMERVNRELKNNEILMEKLEKHYSSLRKVSKDMMESLIDPSPFQSMAEDYVPIPLIDSKPLWLDLSRNHIPTERGNLKEMWEKYTDRMNVYSHMKLPAIKSLVSFLFRNSDYKKIEKSEASEAREAYYVQQPVTHILNELIFGNPKVEIILEEEKSSKKTGKFFVLRINNELMAGGKQHDLLAMQSIIQNIVDTKNTNVTKEIRDISDLVRGIREFISDIRTLLNWFIFEEDNMTQCEIVS